jgi:endonuclease YncB( thermonuclease family)
LKKMQKSLMTRMASVLIAVLVASPVAGQTVIDGDSLQVGRKKYHLNGIDAPEADQVCRDGWPAGYEARHYLEQLVDGKQITCTPLVGKRDDEIIARCRADGVDLSGAMVVAGHAFAFVPHSAQYIGHEAAAARGDRGVHAHHCTSPWEWRSRLRP